VCYTHVCVRTDCLDVQIDQDFAGLTHGVVCNLIAFDIVICHQAMVGVIQRNEVCALDGAAIWISSVSQEVIDSFDGISAGMKRVNSNSQSSSDSRSTSG